MDQCFEVDAQGDDSILFIRVWADDVQTIPLVLAWPRHKGIDVSVLEGLDALFCGWISQQGETEKVKLHVMDWYKQKLFPSHDPIDIPPFGGGIDAESK